MQTEGMDNAFKDAYAELETENKDFDPLPEGTYTAEISSCLYNTAKVPMEINWEFVIVEGEYSKRKLWINSRINPDGTHLKWVLKPFQSLGIVVKNLEDFGPACEKATLITDLVELFVNQKPYEGKIYNNAYVNGLSMHKKTSVDQNTTDDIPF